MTEQEWLQATDPGPMMEFLQGKTSERKMRLFAVACCRHIWHLFTDEQSQKAVEAAEEFADVRASYVAEAAARAAADKAHFEAPRHAVFRAVKAQVHQELELSLPLTKLTLLRKNYRGEEECRQQVMLLLHCIFENPFRPITLAPTWLSWHDGLLVSMARQMYDSRDFTDLPILADALEEAGCQDQDILGHCRSGGEHCRGCWVVDLILGKS